jgi:hypothetical protein
MIPVGGWSSSVAVAQSQAGESSSGTLVLESAKQVFQEARMQSEGAVHPWNEYS